MRNNSETDRDKSAQYKVKPRHHRLILLITENLFKNYYQFFKYGRVYLRKARYAPGASDWKQKRRISLQEKHENIIAAVRN